MKTFYYILWALIVLSSLEKIAFPGYSVKKKLAAAVMIFITTEALLYVTR